MHGHKISVEQKIGGAAHRLKAHYRRRDGLSQRSRAQFRAKSGALAASNRGETREELGAAAFNGSIHEKTNGAINWFWTGDVVAAGAGLESVCGCPAQQGIVTPFGQQACAGVAHDDTGVCAGSSGSAASRKLHTMAQTIFTNSPSHIPTQMAKPILPFTGPF
jgi:hypothetical protein